MTWQKTILRLCLFKILITTLQVVATENAEAQQIDSSGGWGQIRSVRMSGDLRAFWNVTGNKSHRQRALKRGFEHVGLTNAYADYSGNQKRNIARYLKKNSTDNPWNMPDYFSEILLENIQKVTGQKLVQNSKNCPLVLDIEFEFQQSAKKAWANAESRKASGSRDVEEFERAYLKQWAQWFWLPCAIAQNAAPNMQIGIYGAQPFRRDYWGISGKNAQQIDGTHQSDSELWRYIDPYVDFYVASVYVFYDKPDSIFYIASNVEENFQRTRKFGNKPVYSYSWLQFHNSNAALKGTELPAWLADATAVVPYFYGAKGNVLWGWKPRASNYRPLYKNLKVYTDSLGRVADLSEKIARAQPASDDEPAYVLWNEKRPLLKRLKVNADEWIVLACNPWQCHDQISELKIRCGRREFILALEGRHCDIFHLTGDQIRRLQVDYAR